MELIRDNINTHVNDAHTCMPTISTQSGDMWLQSLILILFYIIYEAVLLVTHWPSSNDGSHKPQEGTGILCWTTITFNQISFSHNFIFLETDKSIKIIFTMVPTKPIILAI